MEKVKEFLEALKTSPQAQKLLGQTSPNSEADELRAYEEAAKSLGYSLTAEEISDGIRKLAKKQKAITEQAESGIQNLDLDELESVSGGKKGHDNCEDTFKNKENCWWEDGCDNYINEYSTYVCNHLWNQT